MALRERLRLWLRPAVFLGHNRITLAGAVITTSSALTMLGFWFVEAVVGHNVHPYAGIILFLILPGIFVLGLALMPIGAWWRRRHLRREGAVPDAYPRIDFKSPVLQRAAALVGVLTILNVVILGTATYRGVEHMDSTEFCGLTCHSVMAPEHTAYLGSPHSRVACTECHIGPGAPWFVRSKLSGARQLFAVAFDTHSRPIPSPVKHLRPGREICEQCHWPRMFHGDKFLVRTRFSDDEANTPLTTVLLLKVGGKAWNGLTGIHGRHLDENSRITYLATDDRRQVIPEVTYLDDDGKTVEFVSSDLAVTPEQRAKGERRTMDCIDCHNRPTHVFELPERAVDRAMSEGRISRELPYIKKKAVELLRGEYADRATAVQRIASGLSDYYRAEHPEVYRKHGAQIETAAEQLKAIYDRNVFPGMKVTWGTYPNNIGHEDFLGCFRCHDDNHKAPDGRVISQDCTACHTILAQDEENPKILQDLAAGS